MPWLFRSCIRAISRRDAILILIGAATIHVLYSVLPPIHESSSIIFDTRLSSHDSIPLVPSMREPWRTLSPHNPPPSPSPIPDTDDDILETELVSHAPGWTIFRNLYMAEGTLIIVTSNPDKFPDIKFMTSTGLPAFNTPESIAERMPTSRDMSIIFPEEARWRWEGDRSNSDRAQIFPILGSTVRLLTRHHSPLITHSHQFLLNDPGQCEFLTCSLSDLCAQI
jgi:hypothetical protein